MKKAIPTGRRGFSIVEMIVYCGLLSVLLLVLTDVYTSIINLQLEASSASAIAQDGQYLMARLTYDLRRASSITSPAIAGGSPPQLTVVIDDVPYTYALDNNNLVVTPGEQLNSVNTKISDLSFTHLGVGTGVEDDVQIHFTIQSRIAGEEEQTKTFETTIGLRPN